MMTREAYLRIASVLLTVTALLSLGACSSDSANAFLEVRLTDSPGDYNEVNVDIRSVEIHTSEDDSSSGWKALDVQPGVYDLTKLVNGIDTLLATAELPAGRVSQIRLLLGDNNTIRVGDQLFDLATPSSYQSGLKLNLHADLQEGITYAVLLDFDAARSVVKTGNGTYLLKPVIRAIAEATSGAIDGHVDNPASSPAVYIIDGADTVGTTYADTNGEFLARGVPAGTYTVSFSPASGFIIHDIIGVEVNTGAVTHLGEVEVIEE